MKLYYTFLWTSCLIIGLMSCQHTPSEDTVSNSTTTTQSSNPSTSDTSNSKTTDVKINTEDITIHSPNAMQTLPKTTPKPKSQPTTSDALTIEMTSDFDVNYLMGKFNPSRHKDFTTIPTKHASYKGMLMRKDAYSQFVKMYEAARKEGIYLKIISATRPFHHQKRIWDAKWTGKRAVDGKLLAKAVRDPEARALKILRWSSMPGTSRHHWGTDVDLNNLNNSYFEKGTGKKMYDWLVQNAATYGFCQVYSPKDDKRPYGYQEEKWHWSYIPISKKLTNLYQEKIKNGDIQGFEGAESAELIDVVQKYVLGINQDCL